MNTPEMTKSAEAPTPDLAALVQRGRSVLARIGARRALISLSLATVGAGLALNWSWLTAIGVAPVLVAVAPCAAMCALGLCMPRMMGGNSRAPGRGAGITPDQIADPGSEPAPAPPSAQLQSK
jgi:hypothetical protein